MKYSSCKQNCEVFFLDYTCKIILFKTIHARNQITKLFTVPWNTCYYEELEPVELQNTKTSTAFLEIGKHLKKGEGKPVWFDVKVLFFLELKACFANHFTKIQINILSIYLHHSAFTFIIHNHYSQYLPWFIIRQIKFQI